MMMSVCRQTRLCDACRKTTKPINVNNEASIGTMKVDYRM